MLKSVVVSLLHLHACSDQYLIIYIQWSDEDDEDEDEGFRFAWFVDWSPCVGVNGGSGNTVNANLS